MMVFCHIAGNNQNWIKSHPDNFTITTTIEPVIPEKPFWIDPEKEVWGKDNR
jgi:hypothetical protein